MRGDPYGYVPPSAFGGAPVRRCVCSLEVRQEAVT